jgi:hypothetical protein
MGVLPSLGLIGCGSRTEAASALGTGTQDPNRIERCNGLDDDGRSGVDDPFRDDAGLYVGDLHCGACNQACVPRPGSEIETHCRVTEGLPRCTAESCAKGYAPSRDGHCAKIDERLCLACSTDTDCGSLIGARCLSISGETRCSVPCSLGCPSGYACDATRGACLPKGGSCSCEAGEHYDFACAPDDSVRDAGTPQCVGRSRCDDGVVTACKVASESCDELDNDCDGLVDEGFRDKSGVYSLDPAHCGQCGASCLEDTGLDQKLVCGGDPFAPRCALACPDAVDGVAVGDKLDGDLNIATGCECVVQKLADLPGPIGSEGQLLDENCDGADGIVRESFYVAGDGVDTNPGSPTRPLRTIGAALVRARDSLKTMSRRPHVYVASGAYTETLTLEDGVQVHGGYRRDFRALDPASFLVEVRAPRPATAPGGAALVAIDVGIQETRIEGMSLRGLDAAGMGAALAAYVQRPGPNLVLSRLTLQAGVPGDGRNGTDGSAGDGAVTLAGEGDPPRAAREDRFNECVVNPVNQVRGGGGGRAGCGGVDVSGGSGGASACPSPESELKQPAGSSGSGPAAGSGGLGGQDARGPLEPGDGCPDAACCGLADFSVPTDFEGPRPGVNGGDGSPGKAGLGCTSGRGSFVEGEWSGASGTAGSAGQPGSGGGGGGSGGGVKLKFFPGLCEFVDGLGGGGGGGGAGGCAGLGGQTGASGAPSVALLLVDAGRFTLESSVFITAHGGRGGNGGAGGDGGAGGTGASGGNLPRTARTTPTLAAPFPGGRGGSGGSGGAGGGGGGGCGGASVGVWIVNASQFTPALVMRTNSFRLSTGGEPGSGGGGAQTGSRGTAGEAINVVVQ